MTSLPRTSLVTGQPEITGKEDGAPAFKLAIASDFHYAGAAERARGNDYEYRDLPNRFVRSLLKFHRRFVWLRNPLDQNHLLDRLLDRNRGADALVALGDYSCDSVFVGLSDDAAYESASECLAKIRTVFGREVWPILGDHELGKFSFIGRRGGMRLASWKRATEDLQISPFWQKEIGRYVLIGITSSLVALPIFEAEMLTAERAGWSALRDRHMEEIRGAFAGLANDQRVLLLCHDPTALPFLWREETVRAKIGQIDQTLIGHLHSNLILRQSQVLAGMPVIKFLGHSALRLSSALHEARHWKLFKVRLCPAMAGIELLKDGGFLATELRAGAPKPLRFTLHRIRGGIR